VSDSAAVSAAVGLEEILIPGGFGAAFKVSADDLLEVVDVEGQQVADFIAFAAVNRTEWLSTTHTRSATLRLNLAVGDVLQSNWRNPMFEIVHDDVGMHDVITSMCDQRRYERDYGVKDHRSCRSNFTEALAPWGLAEWQMPDPFNLFQNAPIREDRSFGNEIPTGQAGDKLVFRTLMDAIGSVSACPQDLNPCNGFRPSPILIRILRTSA
jgi:uncharacterized protein YcgI (DUF1989 family)